MTTQDSRIFITDPKTGDEIILAEKNPWWFCKLCPFETEYKVLMLRHSRDHVTLK